MTSKHGTCKTVKQNSRNLCLGLCEGDVMFLHNITGDGDSRTGPILTGLGQANGEMDDVTCSQG